MGVTVFHTPQADQEMPGADINRITAVATSTFLQNSEYNMIGILRYGLLTHISTLAISGGGSQLIHNHLPVVAANYDLVVLNH
jgi:hypothetical protein